MIEEKKIVKEERKDKRSRKEWRDAKKAKKAAAKQAKLDEAMGDQNESVDGNTEQKSKSAP